VTVCVSAAWHVNKSEINEVFANRNLLHGTIPQAADPVVLLRLSTVCLPHGIGYLEHLFPGAMIVTGRFLLLSKSYVIMDRTGKCL
jgi:hypothetical protein